MSKTVKKLNIGLIGQREISVKISLHSLPDRPFGVVSHPYFGRRHRLKCIGTAKSREQDFRPFVADHSSSLNSGTFQGIRVFFIINDFKRQGLGIHKQDI